MSEQKKPYDLGNGVLCGSIAVDGSWLSVSTTHPVVGIVELSGAPPFPADSDGQADLVRAHRAGLTDPATAMLRVDADPGVLVRDGFWHLRGNGWRASADAWAEGASPTLVQRYVLAADGGGKLKLSFRGRLDRPGYGEITPGGPIPPALPPQTVDLDGPTVRVRAPIGNADPVALIEVSSSELSLAGWAPTDEGAVLEVSWVGPLSDAQLLVTVTMSCGAPIRRPLLREPASWSTAPTEVTVAGLAGVEAAATRYTLGCTALESADGECCIITDHRLLPLSWTRDAYYQAALLLAAGPSTPEALAVVERHLAWLWRSGRDDKGVWRRSHLSSGAVKDSGYQVDQQLFPLLELADFRRVTGRWPVTDGASWGEKVSRVWSELPRDDNGMVPGEENPADDPSEYPYLLSSQLLLAYVARRVGEFEDELGLTSLGLNRDAASTLDEIGSTFACWGPFGRQWAYEADGLGGHRLYHDANDVPTALAPLWNLCTASEPRWRATMRFAFSEHNPGFVVGGMSGLGSAHTPGIWPLGDAQEWAVAVAEQNQVRVDSVVRRIMSVMSADGMLPETYHPDSGDWLARHWFAWSGSLVGLLHATFEGRGPWAVPPR